MRTLGASRRQITAMQLAEFVMTGALAGLLAAAGAYALGYMLAHKILHVPYLGTPIVTVREMLGSAGVGSLGRFDSNIGVRLTLGLFSGEVFINPANGDHSFSFGLSLLR